MFYCDVLKGCVAKDNLPPTNLWFYIEITARGPKILQISHRLQRGLSLKWVCAEYKIDYELGFRSSGKYRHSQLMVGLPRLEAT